MSLREGASAVALPAQVTEALARLAQKQRGPQRHRQPVAIIGCQHNSSATEAHFVARVKGAAPRR